MAVGKSGAKLDPEKITLKFGKFNILQKGKKLNLTNIKLINKYLRQSEIEIIVNEKKSASVKIKKKKYRKKKFYKKSK